MGRLPRILPAGYPAHVVHRGNNRGDIFTCEADFLAMRHCLAQAGAGGAIALHAYVFMANHVHLLLTADDDKGISRFMQSAAGRYVAYFNKKYHRTGTLWEGRFFGATVTTDRYALACHRYVDWNPVRAGITPAPREYRWSSHRHYAFGTADPLLTPHSVILALADSPERRLRAYRELLEVPMPQAEIDAIRRASAKRLSLGDEVSDTDQEVGQVTALSCEPG